MCDDLGWVVLIVGVGFAIVGFIFVHPQKKVPDPVSVFKDVKIAIYSAQGPADYDAPNPGKRMIGFEVKLAAGERQRLVVVMTPGGKTGIGEYAETALLSWSEKINGDNPLFMAAQDGHTEIVQALLAATGIATQTILLRSVAAGRTALLSSPMGR